MIITSLSKNQKLFWWKTKRIHYLWRANGERPGTQAPLGPHTRTIRHLQVFPLKGPKRCMRRRETGTPFRIGHRLLRMCKVRRSLTCWRYRRCKAKQKKYTPSYITPRARSTKVGARVTPLNSYKVGRGAVVKVRISTFDNTGNGNGSKFAQVVRAHEAIARGRAQRPKEPMTCEPETDLIGAVTVGHCQTTYTGCRTESPM